MLLPYGISIFQVFFFTILKADSDSSKKSSYTKYPSFLKILVGTWSKIEKTLVAMESESAFRIVKKKLEKSISHRVATHFKVDMTKV